MADMKHNININVILMISMDLMFEFQKYTGLCREPIRNRPEDATNCSAIEKLLTKDQDL